MGLGARAGSTSAAAAPAAPDTARVVGAHMRALRKVRALSLVQVAQATGLSIGYLSQIERGLSSPHLRALTALADALGVAVADLLGAPTAARADGRAPATVIRAGEQPGRVLWRAGIGKRRLAGGATGDGAPFSFSLMAFEPGAGAADEPCRHQGEACGLVLQGRLELMVGAQTWVLNRGDSFQFHSDEPHRFRNLSRGRTQVVLVNWHRPARPGPRQR